MNLNLTLEEKIQKIKDQIADARDYISSDFCIECEAMYSRIQELETELRSLENAQINPKTD
jgi:hypothetical protein